jgi:hypothetical protein
MVFSPTNILLPPGTNGERARTARSERTRCGAQPRGPRRADVSFLATARFREAFGRWSPSRSIAAPSSARERRSPQRRSRGRKGLEIRTGANERGVQRILAQTRGADLTSPLGRESLQNRQPRLNPAEPGPIPPAAEQTVVLGADVDASGTSAPYRLPGHHLGQELVDRDGRPFSRGLDQPPGVLEQLLDVLRSRLDRPSHGSTASPVTYPLRTTARINLGQQPPCRRPISITWFPVRRRFTSKLLSDPKGRNSGSRTLKCTWCLNSAMTFG